MKKFNKHSKGVWFGLILATLCAQGASFAEDAAPETELSLSDILSLASASTSKGKALSQQRAPGIVRILYR